jgi:hypothetical protein
MNPGMYLEPQPRWRLGKIFHELLPSRINEFGVWVWSIFLFARWAVFRCSNYFHGITRLIFG